jgi:hypothetical protein
LVLKGLLQVEATMPEIDWVKFFHALSIEAAENRVGCPSEESLVEFEESTGFKLPTSYKHYVRVFRPGTLAEEYVLRAPGYHVEGLALLNLAISFRNTRKPISP